MCLEPLVPICHYNLQSSLALLSSPLIYSFAPLRTSGTAISQLYFFLLLVSPLFALEFSSTSTSSRPQIISRLSLTVNQFLLSSRGSRTCSPLCLPRLSQSFFFIPLQYRGQSFRRVQEVRDYYFSFFLSFGQSHNCMRLAGCIAYDSLVFMTVRRRIGEARYAQHERCIIGELR